MELFTLEELKAKLQTIKKDGFIRTHRAHDTGIGKTLEDLLEIPENNLAIPDVGEVELKAKRMESESMLTIATKSPLPKGINKVLFDNYKYVDASGSYNLHSTVYGSRLNPQFFQVVFETERLILKNKLDIDAYWPISIFDDVLKTKSDKILLVFAATKGEKKSVNEMFHYQEAYLLSNLNVRKFQTAVQDNRLKIDIRIGSYRSGSKSGKYHDHGTAFRINKRDFLYLFDSFEQVI